jgi:hypothetical protein
MDTDDLSQEAYNIIKKAFLINDFLKTEIGAMAKNYKNENEYLKGIRDYINEIIQEPEEFRDYWRLEEILNLKKLRALVKYITSVMEISMEKRTFRTW